MFRVLLCIPPDYDCDFPPLGTPALCAFLKEKGIDCWQVDLNLEYRRFLVERINAPSLSDREKERLLKPVLVKFFRRYLKGRYYSGFLPRRGDGIFPSLPYGNNSNSSFYFAERLLSSPYLWRYLEDRKENTFYQFYEDRKTLDFLEAQKINLLGISIISPSQAIPAFTLGLLVKKHLPHIHVNIGGQWPTLYRNVFIEKKEFFKCFDTIIVFEGETALWRLAEALKRNNDIAIPNVISKNCQKGITFQSAGEDMNALPCPDFSDLRLKDYDGYSDGEITITYETSRGCYWSKCAYCVDLPLPKPSYRSKHPQLVARDMNELKKKYKAGFLMLGDPGMSPRQMKEVSREILRKRLTMGWWCMARLDSGFNYDLFKTAAAAGLRKINFGFESASDRVCGVLNKGNKKERSLRVIKDCARSGIKVDLQTMIGLPKESFSDGLETVDFLVKNKEFIYNVTFNTYYLTPGNFIFQSPAPYGIEYKNDRFLPFRFFSPFKNIGGMTAGEAQLLTHLYCDLLEKSESETRNPKKDELPHSARLKRKGLRFSLNGESCRLYYNYDEETGNLFL
jgi:radical SAM superfamily enzyme YgiQ (UPF0313 family)